MNKKMYYFLLLAVVLTACRQTKQGGMDFDTFSSRQSRTETAVKDSREAETDRREAESNRREAAKDSAAPDLLKQRVGRGVSEKMLTRRGYVTSYNKQTRTPNWVAWTLTKDHTYGRLLRENERFEEDFSVSEPRATFQDYYNSRYDRGHMCPAGDNKWDSTAMTETFLMTNICPQNHGLNKDDWNELEMQCRTWARRFGELTIVCGPLFEDAGDARYIGRNKVRVPTGFFKVVYRDQPEPRALGFIFKNNGSPQPWREQSVSVDEVERRTGFNFFHQLPDDVEDRVEADTRLKGW
ncbi:MAG: DNA/RNA non-specific endonuclease [Prevotella sp.]|nr:DNA/RNA non-specific endonuclease [Prevotella sp.]